MAQTLNSNTFEAQSAQATVNSRRRSLWIALAAGGLAAMGFVPIYGLTWAVTSIVGGIMMGVGLVCFGALKVYERLKDFHSKASVAAVNMNKAALKAQERLEHVVELKEAILQTNQRIYEILGQVQEVFELFGVKIKLLDFDAIQAAVLLTLEKAQTAMHTVEGSISGLSEDASSTLKEALNGVNDALSDLAKEYVNLAKTAQDGVESVDGNISDFKDRLELTLDKLDAALINLNKTAQGGSDLLAPIRGIGNLFRSLKALLTGSRATEAPEDKASSNESSLESSSEEEVYEDPFENYGSPYHHLYRVGSMPLTSPELNEKLAASRQHLTQSLTMDHYR